MCFGLDQAKMEQIKVMSKLETLKHNSRKSIAKCVKAARGCRILRVASNWLSVASLIFHDDVFRVGYNVEKIVVGYR